MVEDGKKQRASSNDTLEGRWTRTAAFGGATGFCGCGCFFGRRSGRSAWWFGFFGWGASGELVAGREGLFLRNFWPVVGHVKDAFTAAETAEFIRAYSVSGSTTGTFHWFGAFEQDAVDNKQFMQHKLKMPVLAMGGEYFGASFLAEHCRLVAENVSESKIAGAGHWIVQENEEQVRKDLLNFFLN